MMIDCHFEVGKYFFFNSNVNDYVLAAEKYDIVAAISAPIFGRAYIDKWIEANRRMRMLKQENKIKLFGWFTVNPWVKNVTKSIEKNFDSTFFKGLKLFPSLQGMEPNMPIYHPIYEYAEKNKIPIYIPSGYPPMTPLQIADVSEMFKKLKIIIGRGGFSDFWMEVEPALKNGENIYLAISCQSNINALKKAISALGASRFLFETSYPFSDIDLEIKKLSALNLNRNDLEKICYNNAKELFNI